MLPLIALMLAGCSTIPSAFNQPRLPGEKEKTEFYVEVDVPSISPPIDSIEKARDLAWAYSDHAFLGMGAMKFKEEKKNSWIYETLHGFDAFPGEDIIVLKSGLCIYAKDHVAVFREGDRWIADKRKLLFSEEVMNQRANKSAHEIAGTGGASDS